MLSINIPGVQSLELAYLVCDVNGTLAVDGVLREGVIEGFKNLQKQLKIHLVTADTHGKQAALDRQFTAAGIEIQTTILQPGGESVQKCAYIQKLGKEKCAAIGQGANDEAMLKEAALGICVLSQEGVAVCTLLAADILVPDIQAGLDLFSHPMRVIASLRR